MPPYGVWRKAGWVLFLLTLGSASAQLWAKRSAAAKPFKYQPEQNWQLEDLLLAQIPDPQTGKALTPTTRGLFRYKVIRVLGDGSALIRLDIISLESGTSPTQLKAIQVRPPEKPEQLLLMTPDGLVYGPYGKAKDMRDLQAVASLSAWFERARDNRPWVWHKVPLAPIRVGQSARRQMGPESWLITRQKEEIAGGILCDVYKARLQKKDIRVEETTWFYPGEGYVVKRKIMEKRAKDVSADLTQLRLM